MADVFKGGKCTCPDVGDRVVVDVTVKGLGEESQCVNETGRGTDTQKHRQINRQTDRQTETQIDRQKHR